MFDLKNLLSEASKGVKQVKRVAHTYEKAKAGEPLTKREQSTARGLATISKVLNKPSTTSGGTPTQLSQTYTPGMSVNEYAQKKKYGTSDTLATLLSRMSPVKGTREPLQQVFRSAQDKLNTHKGYTSKDVVVELVNSGKVDWDYETKMAALRDPSKYLSKVDPESRQMAANRILQRKQKALDDKRANEKKTPSLETQFYERSQAPLQGAKGDIAMQGLRGSIGAFGKGYLEGRTLGVSDVIGNKIGDFGLGNLYSKEGEATRYISPAQKKKLVSDKIVANTAPQVTALLGSLIGGGQTYGKMATKIGEKLDAIKGPVGEALKRKSVFTAYVVQNGLFEGTNMAIRQATGQDYTVNDFMWGMATDAVFTSLGLSELKQKSVNANIENVVKHAEAIKGRKLTQPEFESAILDSKLLGNKTGRDLMREAGYTVGERRLAYKTGIKGEIPGITKPAPLTDLEQGLKASPEVISKDMNLKRAAAESKGKSGLWSKAKKKWTDTKTGFFDKAAAVDDLATAKVKAKKLSKLEANEFDMALNRQLREEDELKRVYKDLGVKEKYRKGAMDIEEAGNFLTAQHRLDIADHYKLDDAQYRNMFGAFKSDDKALVEGLGGKYEEASNDFREMITKLEDYSIAKGLVAEEDIARARKAYKNYVPLYEAGKDNKDIDFSAFDTPVGSLGKQTVFMNLKGNGGKATMNPYEALIKKIDSTVHQGLKNDVAAVFGKWADKEGFGDEIRRLKPGEKAPHTVSFLEKGKRVDLAVPKEIADFAKGAGVAKTNAVLNLSREIMRGFKAGTTGVNPAFALSNIVKDIQTAKINSRYGLRVLDIAFGLGGTLKGKIAESGIGKKLGIKEAKWAGRYKELGGASGSEFDIFRGKTKRTLNNILSIKQQKGVVRKSAATLVRTGKGLRNIIEGVFDTSEQLTRVGVFRRNVIGYTKKFIKEGMGKTAAKTAAEKMALTEALDATANFSRGGRFRSYITGLLPYRSAGLAGARTFQKSMKRAPLKTAFRIVKNLVLPEAGLMAWNMADPNRRKIYEDIQPWEKDMNFIIISPWATYDKKTKTYSGVYKLPKPPGVMSITIPLRRKLEAAITDEPDPQLGQYLNALTDPLGSMEISEGKTPLDTVGNTALNLLTPQAIKAPLEVKMNKKFWEGKDLIPDYLKSKNPEDQHYDWTPEEYQMLGEKLHMSPLVIERLVKGYGGSATEQIIGAKNPINEITRRFKGVRGGRLEDLMKQQKEEKKSSNRIKLI